MPTMKQEPTGNPFSIPRSQFSVQKEENRTMGDHQRPRSDNPIPLRERTKAYALRIIRLYGALPPTTEGQVIGKQLLRSGTAVGANYREGTRARSTSEMIAAER
jgi:hypothetical protein